MPRWENKGKPKGDCSLQKNLNPVAGPGTSRCRMALSLAHPLLLLSCRSSSRAHDNILAQMTSFY
jgi:hypothetical protein